MSAKRTDAIQKDIVKALRALGATVQDLSAVGRGCPDLLVAFQNRNHLLEVKAPKGPRGGGGGKLTVDQVRWHADWAAPVHVVDSVDGAIRTVVSRRYG